MGRFTGSKSLEGGMGDDWLREKDELRGMKSVLEGSEGGERAVVRWRKGRRTGRVVRIW